MQELRTEQNLNNNANANSAKASSEAISKMNEELQELFESVITASDKALYEAYEELKSFSTWTAGFLSPSGMSGSIMLSIAGTQAGIVNDSDSLTPSNLAKKATSLRAKINALNTK